MCNAHELMPVLNVQAFAKGKQSVVVPQTVLQQLCCNMQCARGPMKLKVKGEMALVSHGAWPGLGYKRQVQQVLQ